MRGAPRRDDKGKESGDRRRERMAQNWEHRTRRLTQRTPPWKFRGGVCLHIVWFCYIMEKQGR